MPTFSSYDGTVLAYRTIGSGPLLVCVAGGPARAGVYYGDLGGLATHRALLLLDNRGTGESQDAADPETYRCDRLVADVEALRLHLGLEKLDLLGHSAGASIATLYAAAHPERLSSLALITGGHRMAGCAIQGAPDAAVLSRAGESWYPEAKNALDELFRLGDDAPAELEQKIKPFSYGPWSDAAKAHAAEEASQRRNPLARKMFQFTPGDEVRELLTKVQAPVLVYAGALDPSPTPAEARAFADLFPNGRLVVQPGAAHYPWIDDPAFFVNEMVMAPPG